eukprot:gnl/MRDRNA2_/MRDRNA2_99182_c0_seq1.p1 gnl/MRDRNA2_/MRDRNA2_99182_c0~~gnl/MRDRNA2_/MRDRNA2_99182_c0_seq1.p1  ORF type:complete len:462 (+),score=39.00 gnl/MRDRNA2_/MRDRNA2_99182_c0_seq1:55-1386(+)
MSRKGGSGLGTSLEPIGRNEWRGDTEAPEAHNDSIENGCEAPPVYILLLTMMFMFQGYGVMNGNPVHALKLKLDIQPDESAAFQNATASFQLTKLLMRICQIAFLVFLQPNGIVYVSFLVMFFALCVPVILVWGVGITDLWVVYLQYSLGGIAIGLFEGTFLAVVSPLGKDTKTMVIMGTPLGFAVHNIILGTCQQWGMPPVVYFAYSLCCLPFAALIFYHYAPSQNVSNQGKGCAVIANSMKHASDWLPAMLPWLLAKFVGNFVLEDCFPLLFNTFNSAKVPLLAPSSTSPTIPFQYYTSLYWFVMFAAGDTISRRVPQYLSFKSQQSCWLYIVIAIAMCVGGEALNFLLLSIVTGIACFISNFGNGFIYGCSAKFIDMYVPEEHRYAAYNLWCFTGDLAGYAGQGGLSVDIANSVCGGHHYEYVCVTKPPTTTHKPSDQFI